MPQTPHSLALFSAADTAAGEQTTRTMNTTTFISVFHRQTWQSTSESSDAAPKVCTLVDYRPRTVLAVKNREPDRLVSARAPRQSDTDGGDEAIHHGVEPAV